MIFNQPERKNKNLEERVLEALEKIEMKHSIQSTKVSKTSKLSNRPQKVSLSSTTTSVPSHQ